jgi:hypothetical protein
MFFGLGLTTSSTATIISKFESIRSEFAKRVLQEGGTIEGSSCFTDDIRDLTAVHAEDITIVRDFSVRVASESGVIAEPSCLEDVAEELIPDYSNELTLTYAFADRVRTDGGLIREYQGAYDDIDALT